MQYNIYMYTYVSSIKIIRCYFIFFYTSGICTCRSWHDVKMYKMRARDSVLEIVGDDTLWKKPPGKDKRAIIMTEINDFCETNASFLSIFTFIEKKENT